MLQTQLPSHLALESEVNFLYRKNPNAYLLVKIS